MIPKCPVCKRVAMRNEKHDAYQCPACRVWVEGKCSDPDCQFCRDRPDEPSGHGEGKL